MSALPQDRPPAAPAPDAPGAAPPRSSTREIARATRYRRPVPRLLKAYRETSRVVASYLWLRLRRRFLSAEGAARATDDAHMRNARRVLRTIVELQGLFIKFGQLISIMANFLPEAFRRELQALQDQVPPRPRGEIEARLRDELGGREPSEVFAEFDPVPVASASIGQVHAARLKSGERVAVKVQYPDIDVIVRTDLRALRRIFRVLGWFLPAWGFDTIDREIREVVLAELDFRKEADAMARIAKNFKGRADVRLPRVMPDYSTGRVLTTEWMAGAKASDLERLASTGVDRRRAARLALEAYCQQIFMDGVYHADPHPGNLLFRPGAPGTQGPVLVFLDFGAVAEVSPGLRKGLVSFLQGAMTRDTSRMASALREMGFISRRADPVVFDRLVEYFHDKFRSQIRVDGFSLRDIKFDPQQKLAALFDLRDLNVSLHDLRDAFHVPKEWVLLERTLLLLLGVCTTLDPEMQPGPVIQPFIEKFLLGEKKEWSEAVVELSQEAALTTLALPGEIGRALTLATRGDLEVRVRDLDAGVRALYTVGQQILWAFLAASATGLAVVFDGRGQEGARDVAGGAAGLFGLMLLFNLWRGLGAVRRDLH